VVNSQLRLVVNSQLRLVVNSQLRLGELAVAAGGELAVAAGCARGGRLSMRTVAACVILVVPGVGPRGVSSRIASENGLGRESF
jgi:hypothetical protein